VRARRFPVTEDTLVWRSYDCFNRRDAEGAIALYTSDCRWSFRHFTGWPDDPEYPGHDGLRKLFADFLSVWGEFRITPEAIWGLGGDRWLVQCTMSSTGASSGVPVSMDMWQICRAGRKITEVENFNDRDEVLAAAGLSGDDL
jgi:ketosteroid isomerase-like protein